MKVQYTASKFDILFTGRYALSFASEYLKKIYAKRTRESVKTVHVVSSVLKATATWHGMRTLQVVNESSHGKGFT